VLYDNRTVYVGTDEYDGGLHALDISRGRERWKQKLGAVRFTPLLDNNVLYVGTDAGAVFALSTEGGARLWRAGLRGAIAETMVDAGAHIVTFTNHDSVFALRKTDGAVLARGVLPGTPSAAPALAGNTIMVPVHPGVLIGLDAHSLAQQWRADANSPVLTGPVVDRDGNAYIADRDGTVYRVRDGRAEQIAQLPHSLAGSLTLARDHLVIGSYDGTLLAVSMDGKVIWTFKLDDSIVAPVAISGGAIYVPLLRGRIVKLR
jgi:outer membrane protein assembly factor BamB